MNSKGKTSALSLFVCVAALQAAPALSAVQTWDWDSSNQSFNGGNNSGNSIFMTGSDGNNLTITGWSDSNDNTPVDSIETAKLNWQQSGTSLGMQNNDENTTSPDHSIDSSSSDSSGGSRDGLLLQFDTAVALSDIDLSWAVGGGSNRVDISLLAWNGTGGAGIAGDTWASILDNNGGNYSAVGTYNVGLSYYAVNPGVVESTSWLIAAYNPVFGLGGADFGDDGFKIDAIRTESQGDEPPTDVPVPGSFALIILGLGLLGARRKLA